MTSRNVGRVRGRQFAVEALPVPPLTSSFGCFGSRPPKGGMCHTTDVAGTPPGTRAIGAGKPGQENDTNKETN